MPIWAAFRGPGAGYALGPAPFPGRRTAPPGPRRDRSRCRTSRLGFAEDATIVDGRVLMRDRELLTIDVSSTVRELAERLPALVDRGHGGRIQEYDT
ncbi:hypothetical protein GCM10022206_20870 [Streptomyces chiangmaiensis]